jgi:hypothetical protein
MAPIAAIFENLISEFKTFYIQTISQFPLRIQ